jgi:UDP-glucuronate decarboxylase
MGDAMASIIRDDAARILDAVDLGELAGKKILLTGASGLIGSYFLASLGEFSRKTRAVFSVTALVHSEPPVQMGPLQDFDGFRLLQGDLSDPGLFARLEGFDYIIHAAGYGQPGRFMENPVKTISLNTTATMALIEKLNPEGRFLFISTSEVYSGLPDPPYRETQIGTTNTTHQRSCYIEGKRCGEAILNAYRERGVKASSARLALAYGPGTKKGDRRVINSFIERGLSEKQITLQDMGSAKRTYCYVSDAVEILWHILLRGEAPIYNVGGFSRTTIAELAQKIGAYLQVPVHFPKDSQELGGAPDDVHLDMSLVEREFGKKSYLPFDQGLARTIEWQKGLYL